MSKASVVAGVLAVLSWICIDVLYSAALTGSVPDWGGTRCTHDMLYLAYSVHDTEGGAVYVGFNPHHYTITVSLPEGPSVWRRVADTALPSPQVSYLRLKYAERV